MKRLDEEQQTNPGNGESFKAPEALIAGMFLGALGLALLALLFSSSGLEWSWEYWGSSDRTFDRSTIFRNFGLLALAMIGLPLAIWRSWTAYLQTKTAMFQARLSERGHFIERFQKSALMLDNENEFIRSAGISALKNLAENDADGHYIQVQSLLCTYIRSRSQQRTKLRDDFDDAPPYYSNLDEDLIDALHAFSALRGSVDSAQNLETTANWRPNLSNANLAEASLTGFDLRNADLTSAKLTRAQCSKAVFDNAKLDRSDCRLGSFWGSKFRETSVHRANVGDADFHCVDFTNASLSATDLKTVTLTEANISGARMGGRNNVSQEILEVAWAWIDMPPRGLPQRWGRPWQTFDAGPGGQNRSKFGTRMIDCTPPEEWQVPPLRISVRDR